MFVLNFVVFFLLTFNISDGARILGLFPINSYSHFILGHSLLEELAKKGHEVTMINSCWNETPVDNYTNIYLDGLRPHIFEAMKIDLSNKNRAADMEKMPLLALQIILNEMTLIVGDFVYKHEGVQEILKKKFDVVIVEQFYNDAMKGFCHHFGAHCIVFSTIGSSKMTNYLVANPYPASYIPDFYLPYSTKMTFLERVHNFIFGITSNLIDAYYSIKQNKLLNKLFPTAPHIHDLLKNISIVLLNSHVSTNQPVPHVPAMVEVGGLHIKPPKKLPEDLQRYLDDAKDGAVYFSLGSNIKSNELPVEKREEILKAFAKLKLKVLWKFEDDNLRNKPRNVLIQKWFPQQDILAHPNVKLFITHGGLLSTTEAIYHGVPLIGIPFFGDQRTNMQESVRLGFALQITFNDLNEETLSNALNTILKNESKNVKQRSIILHDRPMNGLDTAVYWVEYVMRHNGAHHLKTSAIELTWYQYYLWDVLLFLAVCTVAPLILVCKLLKCFRKRGQKCEGKTKKE